MLMKNTLFILRKAVRVCGRRASRRVFTRAVAGRARQSTPTQFIILFIDFFSPFFEGVARMSATTLHLESIFHSLQNKLCAASQPALSFPLFL